jgi:hypothetical protein
LVEGFDHQPRVSLTPMEPQAPAQGQAPVQEVTE